MNATNTAELDFWIATAKYLSQGMTEREKDDFLFAIKENTRDERSILRDASLIFGISGKGVEEKFEILDACLKSKKT